MEDIFEQEKIFWIYLWETYNGYYPRNV